MLWLDAFVLFYCFPPFANPGSIFEPFANPEMIFIPFANLGRIFIFYRSPIQGGSCFVFFLSFYTVRIFIFTVRKSREDMFTPFADPGRIFF